MSSFLPVRTASQIVAALKGCGKMRDLEGGKKLHLDAIAAGLHSQNYVAATLIGMYSKCRDMALAREAFDAVSVKDVVTWTSLIQGYLHNGECSTALDLFNTMDCEANSLTYVAALKACGGLAGEKESEKHLFVKKGSAIHKHVRQLGLESDIFVATTLVDMYSKCGSMQFAREVFDRMPSKSVVAWNCLIHGYVQNGECLLALDLFTAMNCNRNPVTYVAALKACCCLVSDDESKKAFCLEKGIAVHKLVQDDGFESEIFVANTLVDMYSKCGSMDRAREVFDRMSFKNAVTWTFLILGYVQNGESLVALDMYSSMDCQPDSFAYVAALNACAGFGSEKQAQKQLYLEKGSAIHKQVNQRGFESGIFVASALVDMYCKCGSVDRAREVFDRMRTKNVVTWTCIILGYVQNGESLVAMDLFTVMDCEPNAVTYIAVLKACAALASVKESEKQFCLQKGIAIHKQVKEQGFESDMFVACTLVDMYSKCGNMDRAREVFEKMSVKSSAPWTSLILGYVQNGQNLVALDLFTAMDCTPSSLVLCAALKACGGLVSENECEKQSCLEKGIGIHKQVKEFEFESDLLVASCLVDMYSKCGDMHSARAAFDKVVCKDVVIWSSLIQGYVLNGESLGALDLFASMDCEPSPFTYVAVVQACASLTALQVGLCIHSGICKLGLEQDRVLATTLMDFYGKCGCMDRVEALFSNMNSPGVVSWNSLIAGYSSFGDSSRVFNLVKQMQEAGVAVDTVTFLSVLTVCSHSGLVDKGKAYWEQMTRGSMSLSTRHYACMVDMLGRSNRLKEALEVIKSMPVAADSITWRSLLGACRKWKNSEVGKIAFNELVAADSADGAAYVLMSDIYRSLFMWRSAEELDAKVHKSILDPIEV